MSNVEARRRWAYRMIRRCTEPPPPYGSAEWLNLPEGSPAKVAAVIVAAEAWAQYGDDLERELQTELEVARQAHKQTEDADYAARATAHRAEWEHLGRRPAPFAGQAPPSPLEAIGAEHLRLIRGEAS